VTGVEVKLGPEVIEDIVSREGIFAAFTECGYRGSVGGCADENLVNVLWIDVTISGDADSERSGGRVDEKVRSWSSWIVLSAWCCCLVTLQQADFFT